MNWRRVWCREIWALGSYLSLDWAKQVRQSEQRWNPIQVITNKVRWAGVESPLNKEGIPKAASAKATWWTVKWTSIRIWILRAWPWRNWGRRGIMCRTFPSSTLPTHWLTSKGCRSRPASWTWLQIPITSKRSLVSRNLLIHPNYRPMMITCFARVNRKYGSAYRKLSIERSCMSIVNYLKTRIGSNQIKWTSMNSSKASFKPSTLTSETQLWKPRTLSSRLRVFDMWCRMVYLCSRLSSCHHLKKLEPILASANIPCSPNSQCNAP